MQTYYLLFFKILRIFAWNNPVSLFRQFTPSIGKYPLYRINGYEHRCKLWSRMEAGFHGIQLTPGLVLGLHPANERRRYFVTTSHWLGANLESALNLVRELPSPPHDMWFYFFGCLHCTPTPKIQICDPAFSANLTRLIFHQCPSPTHSDPTNPQDPVPHVPQTFQSKLV